MYCFKNNGIKNYITSAPNATKVSMRTAVCTVMCKHPAILAPFSGLDSPYFTRNDINPGISFSARVISLRPHSERDKSATKRYWLQWWKTVAILVNVR